MSLSPMYCIIFFVYHPILLLTNLILLPFPSSDTFFHKSSFGPFLYIPFATTQIVLLSVRYMSLISSLEFKSFSDQLFPPSVVTNTLPLSPAQTPLSRLLKLIAFNLNLSLKNTCSHVFPPSVVFIISDLYKSQ